jgi:threonine/homoserine/homoserine lactone efflux protein
MRSLLLNVPAFFATTFLLAMVPGQGVAMVLRQSILGGRRAACYSVIGNSTGLFIWGSCSAVGLSVIFTQSETAYSILKWSGVTFLLALSIQTLLTLKNEHGKFDLDLPSKSTPWSAFRLGLITNLTNVKAAVFAVAFIPEFVPKDFSLGWGIFIFGFLWPIVSTSWYFILIWSVDKSAEFIQKPQVRRILTAISAIGIAALAIGLALSSK